VNRVRRASVRTSLRVAPRARREKEREGEGEGEEEGEGEGEGDLGLGLKNREWSGASAAVVQQREEALLAPLLAPLLVARARAREREPKKRTAAAAAAREPRLRKTGYAPNPESEAVSLRGCDADASM